MKEYIIKSINYTKIRKSLSDARLSTYHNFIMKELPVEFVLYPYLTIQSVTAMFYPTLQLLEVCLRNHIHNSLTEYYQARSEKISLPGLPEKWYEWMPETRKTQNKITDAAERAQKEIKKRQIIPDDIICRLSFGVWVRLLEERKFNSDPLHFWQGIAGSVFPNTGKSKTEIIESLKKANNLRNRIFHHEPAWNKSDVSDINSAHKKLCELHDSVIEIISWMSPDLIKYYTGTTWNYKNRFEHIAEETFAAAKRISETVTIDTNIKSKES